MELNAGLDPGELPGDAARAGVDGLRLGCSTLGCLRLEAGCGEAGCCLVLELGTWARGDSWKVRG